jgi:hypothetical protein
MGVYVDLLGPSIPNKNWPYKHSCHLIADTEIELHDFARRIGLKRAWHQKKAFQISHYDLTTHMRRKAINYGAEAITQHQFVVRLRKARAEEIARRKTDGTVQKVSS